MECHECDQLISAYIDRELSAGQHQLVKEHLLQCSSCQQTVDSFLTFREELRQEIGSIALPPGLEQQIMRAVKLEKTRTAQQLWVTALILALLTSPILILFSPIIKTLVHVAYVATTALWRTVPALLQTVIPVFPLVLGIGAALLTLLGIYLVRTLLRGIRYNEVFS